MKVFLYFRFCGYRKPPTIQTFSNILTIKFVSDASLSSDGFTAIFDFVDMSKGKHLQKQFFEFIYYTFICISLWGSCILIHG